MARASRSIQAEAVYHAYPRKRGHKARALLKIAKDIERYNGDWQLIRKRVKYWVRNKQREQHDLKWWPYASRFFEEHLWETDEYVEQPKPLDVTYAADEFRGREAHRAAALFEQGRLECRDDGKWYELIGE